MTNSTNSHVGTSSAPFAPAPEEAIVGADVTQNNVVPATTHFLNIFFSPLSFPILLYVMVKVNR